MRFLLSNDDGPDAIGLQALKEVVSTFGSITTLTPDRNQSGASNALTLRAPLYVTPCVDTSSHHVNGFPVDCVHLAVTDLLDEAPDMVLSGINDGPNLGDDVLYSGTVAAAMEGRFFGCPCIALSLAGAAPSHYETARHAVTRLISGLLAAPLAEATLLNVNIPDVPLEQLAGVEVTRLGRRRQPEPARKMQDPKGSTVYWVGPAGPPDDCAPGTDFHAIAARKVSITPLQADLTCHRAIPQVSDWLQQTRLYEQH